MDGPDEETLARLQQLLLALDKEDVAEAVKIRDGLLTELGLSVSATS